MRLTLLTFVAIIFGTVQQKCELFRTLPFVETGSFKLVSGLTNETLGEYSSNVNFISSNNLEVSTSLVYLENYYDNREVYFRLRTLSYLDDKKKFTIYLKISTSAIWSQAYVNYLATSSNDLQAGIFSALSNQIDEGKVDAATKTESISIRTGVVLRPQLASKTTIIPYAFISGIRTPNRFINLKLEREPVYSKGYLVLALNTTQNAFQDLEVLEFTFVLYSPQTQLQIKNIIDLTGSLQVSFECKKQRTQSITSEYFGLGGLDAESLMSLYVEQRRRLLLSEENLKIFTQAFGVRGISLRVAFDIQRTSAASSNCLDPNFAKVIVNGTETCREKASLCEAGNTYFQGACVRLRLTSSQECGQNELYNISTNECQCQKNYQYRIVDGSQKCIKSCEPTETFNSITLQCDCLNGSSNFRGKCLPCISQDQQWDRQNMVCSCKEGFQQIQGVCYLCSANAIYNGVSKKCICKDGYVGNGVICRRSLLKSTPQLPEFEIVFVNGAA